MATAAAPGASRASPGQGATTGSATSRQSILVAWVFALAVSGYGLAGLLSAWLGMSSTATSIPFRLFAIAASILLLVDASISRTRFRVDLALLAFWLLYLLRLSWDLVVQGVPGAGSALVFFVATSLVPCAALVAATRHAQEPPIARTLLFLAGATSVMALVMWVFGFGRSAIVEGATDRLYYESFNPISLGHAAATAVIAAVALWRRASGIWLVVLVGAIGAALLVLGVAASRGPVLALVAAVAFAAVARRQWFWLILPAAVMAFAIPQLLTTDGFDLLNRFATLGDDESGLERLLYMARAVEQFLANPLFGSAFVELESGQYPHNLFIESAMAMGVVGLGLALVIAFRAFRSAWRFARRGEILLPMLFIQYFVGAQVSGAIWGSAALWATLALLLAPSLNAKQARPA